MVIYGCILNRSDSVHSSVCTYTSFSHAIRMRISIVYLNEIIEGFQVYL